MMDGHWSSLLCKIVVRKAITFKLKVICFQLCLYLFYLFGSLKLYPRFKKLSLSAQTETINGLPMASPIKNPLTTLI